MAKADHELAQSIGVPVGVILAMRTGADAVLNQGEHWQEEGPGRVAYTVAGLAAVRAHLSPEKKEGPPAVEKKEGPGPELALPILIIHPNPTWVTIRTPDHERTAVRVRNNQKMRRGQMLRVQQLGDGRWQCITPGQAVPIH